MFSASIRSKSCKHRNLAKCPCRFGLCSGDCELCAYWSIWPSVSSLAGPIIYAHNHLNSNIGACYAWLTDGTYMAITWATILVGCWNSSSRTLSSRNAMQRSLTTHDTISAIDSYLNVSWQNIWSNKFRWYRRRNERFSTTSHRKHYFPSYCADSTEISDLWWYGRWQLFASSKRSHRFWSNTGMVYYLSLL